jgi:hypothetical protein
MPESAVAAKQPWIWEPVAGSEELKKVRPFRGEVGDALEGSLRVPGMIKRLGRIPARESLITFIEGQIAAARFKWDSA